MEIMIAEHKGEDVERVADYVNGLIDFCEKISNAVNEIVRIIGEVYEKIENAVDTIMIEWERRRNTRRYRVLKVLNVYTGIEMLDIRRMLRRVYRARSCC